MSNPILSELKNVLRRTKFEKYITQEERQIFLAEFVEQVVFFSPIESIEECRDPKDNKYLELAVTGQAECIVTGDEDLLILNPFRGIQIVKIQEFLEINTDN
jgi:putative PIN family toxin of toxin-antitoxin system